MPRPLRDQTVVITGASSGIGREAALMFGERGSSVVLAARNEAALQEVAHEITRLGGRAHAVVTDVAEWEQVQELAGSAVSRFGRVDTWVNNAAVSVYAPVDQMAIEEVDRVLQVNLLGQIYGVKAVLPHMKAQREGTIVNVGSVLSERAVPLQAVYCASKHAVKGFTEALRMELEHDHSGINVTLLMPASTNTPMFEHARSKVGKKPAPIPPIYEPRVVAEAILHAAEYPQRDIIIGAGKLLTTAEKLSPTLVDRYMLQGERGFKQQLTDQPDDGRDNLFQPMDGTGSVTGSFGRRSKSTSLYTRWLELHPARQRVVLGLGLLGAFAFMRRVAR